MIASMIRAVPGMEVGPPGSRVEGPRAQTPPGQDLQSINDPKFEDKLIDVVGVSMNPPEPAIALSFDEKSQIQALDRTQQSLPMKQ